MKTYRQFIRESSFSRLSTPYAIYAIGQQKKITDKIHRLKEPEEKIRLLSQQNLILTYLSALNLAVGSEDKRLLSRIRRGNQ